MATTWKFQVWIEPLFKCKQTSDKRKLEFELKLYIQLFQRLGGPFRFQAVSEALGHDLLVCLLVSQIYILTWFISYHLFDWLTLLSRLLFLCGSKITLSTWYVLLIHWHWNTIWYRATRDIPGECSGDIFLSLDFLPTGSTLTITNESVENLKVLNYIYSIRKTLIKKAKHVDDLLW